MDPTTPGGRPVRTLVVGPLDVAVAEQVTAAVRDALAGGPALAPVAAGPDRGAHAGPDAGTDAGTRLGQEGGTVASEVALVVRTSGSSGDPREVLLDDVALRASATATHGRLGGAGRWLLALPLAHVAGLQVVVRSVVAGYEPVVLAGTTGFDPTAWIRAVHAAPDDAPLHSSLVPTQLHRLVAALDDTAPRAVRALTDRLGAVLLGGAATPAALLDRARTLGLPVVTTYGMTETCGGCVYDGVPLSGVDVRLDDDGAVELAGPVLARGYRARHDLDRAAFRVDPSGTRWFATADLGTLDDGVLRVLGRRDDVLVTGGAKVAPAAVEAAVAGLPGVAEVCVVGVPDPEWGQAVTAVVVGGGGATPDLATVRAHVTRTLGRAAAPRHLVDVAALPLRGPGKVDRAAVARLAAERLAVHGPG
ncbi:o-succinylbenzoate--CoA ligase [Actinotalea sp. Marseille-Q4924]|uniref:o-succinylbenzoate--CoA ligase n=1 Tax=Actinotalea sp. Marseille-Q4924 TaxID=2866571 RepID=UPI001CE47D20|nr:o-succinylbenzoate--CoA ligase [Actinotalea sp. Marseille-Q4924]